jgi:hypothetical protein
MNRLRDVIEREGGLRGDPLFRRGVELLRETPPTVLQPDAKARVLRAIRQAPSPAARGLRTLALKLAVAGAVALVAGTAGAVIAHRWIAPALDGGADHSVQPARVKVRVPPPPRVEAPSVVAPVDLPAAVPVEPPASKSRVRTAVRRPAVPMPSAAAVARERTEVLDALIALRREHDPVRAGTLLARYLAAHPHGALREEALTLAIEAADARGDRAAGAQLGRTYQGEFPAGRFLPFARSHTH